MPIPLKLNEKGGQKALAYHPPFSMPCMAVSLKILPEFFHPVIGKPVFGIAARRIGNFPARHILTRLLQHVVKALRFFLCRHPPRVFLALGNGVVQIRYENHVFNPK